MSITLTGWCTVNCTLKRLELSTRTLIFQFSYEKIDVSRYVFFSRRFKYLNLRVGPLQYILWLGTNGGLGELFQDVWQFRRNVDLLWTINGFVLLRHNSPFQNKMLMYCLHGRKDCMKSRWRVFGYYDDTKQYSRQALRVEKKQYGADNAWTWTENSGDWFFAGICRETGLCLALISTLWIN